MDKSERSQQWDLTYGLDLSNVEGGYLATSGSFLKSRSRHRTVGLLTRSEEESGHL
jgi:hypothetical protein